MTTNSTDRKKSSDALEAVSPELKEMVTGNIWTKMFFKIGTQETAEGATDLIGLEKAVTRSLSATDSQSDDCPYNAILRDTQRRERLIGGHQAVHSATIRRVLDDLDDAGPSIAGDVITALLRELVICRMHQHEDVA